MTYRQGDVLIRKVDKLPSGKRKRIARERGRIVLAHGEVTGHAHAIAEPEVSFWMTDDGKRYLQAKVRAFLDHEEHRRIELPAGVYEVIQQQEYREGQIERVAD